MPKKPLLSPSVRPFQTKSRLLTCGVLLAIGHAGGVTDGLVFFLDFQLSGGARGKSKRLSITTKTAASDGWQPAGN
jgi:hypothetical protein